MQSPVHRLLVFVAAAALFVSCSKSSPIVGIWTDLGGYGTLEFSKDGTVHKLEHDKSEWETYELIGDDRIKLERTGNWALAGPMILHFSISGNELTLTNDQGAVSRYRRTGQF